MSPAYFKPRQMLAALMLGGVCATASATNADDLNRVLDSLNGNAPANDSTAADQAPANTSVSNSAAGLKVFGTLDHAAGRRKNQVQSAKLAADASENAYQSEVELLTYNTSRAYLDVVRYRRTQRSGPAGASRAKQGAPGP